MDTLLKKDNVTRRYGRHESTNDTNITRVRVDVSKSIWHTQPEDF